MYRQCTAGAGIHVAGSWSLFCRLERAVTPTRVTSLLMSLAYLRRRSVVQP
ncbi:hypothetical protein [Streptomyces sp. NBC_00091]|uniref:hypothetical protein n=1 Tax=Streptomyces sp. NBC_00091 TaxID=2975648 RepID=UPI002257D07C|nr:hypothetical protein [Streptomyces sp. NBC_00091]MCX5374894.1 hypothetical protein [Streptomyces sp. NBC_00091]MCX5380273.1 hypothetical protein [Streptomyces sp. NBC_00091]